MARDLDYLVHHCYFQPLVQSPVYGGRAVITGKVYETNHGMETEGVLKGFLETLCSRLLSHSAASSSKNRK
jgi:hypothetical protein